MEEKKFNVVNKGLEKIDALGLACGYPMFTDDVDIKDMLYGKIMFSPYAHAKIKNIDISDALKVKGVKAVVTYKDVPRIAHTTAGQGYPEPSPYDTYVLDNKVRFVGDRVCAVAAETPEACDEAISKIKVDWEILPAVYDVFEAIEGKVVIHDEKDSTNIPDPKHNIAAKFDFEVAPKKWFEEADYVIENTYTMPYLQHCAIEPHTTICYFDHQNRLIIRSSTQVPFHVRRIVSYALNIPVKNIRVIKPRIGGGFGSKQEILLEDITALLAMKTKRPVKMEYSRKDVFVSSRTRHPAYVKIKSGVKKDGTITDLSMEIILNTGAYGSHALTVMMCSGSHTLPMYRVKNNIKFSGKSVYTNLPVAGAYRGYGATQGFFALESHMDIMAEKIGMDPVEFRKRNYIKLGETSPVFKAMGEGREGVEQYITSIGLDEAIERGLKEIKWYEKKEKYKKLNQNPKSEVRYGLGMACMMQGSGIAEIDMASATIKMNEDGSFNLLIGATDIGTGSDTILAQIAAETLGVELKDIIVYSSDTDLTPFDVGAYASSTTFVSGGAVKKAAEKVRDIILKDAAKILDEPVENLRIEEKHVVSKSGRKISFKEIANTAFYYHDQHQIIASASHVGKTSPPPFSAHFADVSVNIRTGVIKVLNYVACVDCGTAINPVLAEGQIEGAVINGISHSLSEEFEFSKNGTVLNANFRRYKIYTSRDLPNLKAIIIPTYEPDGPYGAKSVSEIGINGPLPVIANAVYDACGIRLVNPPFTPDKVLKALKEKNNV